MTDNLDSHSASPAESPLRRLLEGAARDLFYSSESDRPFEFVSFTAAPEVGGGQLTPKRFAEVAGAALGAPIEERDLDGFLAHHLEASDPRDAQAQRLRPRYEALKVALRGALRDVRVFRVGRVEVRCYLVGWASDGSLAGLATTAVET